jgi:hypothetical protein
MARDFDGLTDRIDYPNVFDSDGVARTFAAWVNLDNLNNDYIVINIGTGSNGSGDRMQYDSSPSGSCRQQREAGGTDPAKWRFGVGGVTSGVWTHLCTTSDSNADAAGMECYVNGAIPGSVGSQGGGTENAHSGLYSIGGRNSDDTKNLPGLIAEVGVWDRVITTDEINALVKGFSPLHFRRGLRAYYKLIGRKDIDIVGGGTPTYDGTSIIEHPRIIYPG